MTAYVTVTEVAEQLHRHHTSVRRDLRRRGYGLHHARALSGQAMKVLSRADAERYLAERQSELLTAEPSRTVAVDVQPVLTEPQMLSLNVWSEQQGPRTVYVKTWRVP